MPESPSSSVRDLKAFEDGKTFSSLLLLKRASSRTAGNGNPFLSVELGDRSGSFTSTVFSDNPAFETLKGLAEGSVVRVEGRIEHYQGRLSPRLVKLAAVDDDAIGSDPRALAGLVETAPEDPVLLWSECERFIEDIGHPKLRATVKGVFEEIGDAFRAAPAAVSMHHAYRHGLLEHTTHMARAARALMPVYPEVDSDLAMAGILLHDVGKTIEYEGALAPRRGRRGILQGHVVLGYQLVRKAGLTAGLDAELLERLEHIVLSHQGEMEWGAAAMAATPEAVFVSMVDNLDAKMGMVQRALRQADGSEFSERLPGLDAPLLTRKPPTAG